MVINTRSNRRETRSSQPKTTSKQPKTNGQNRKHDDTNESDSNSDSANKTRAKKSSKQVNSTKKKGGRNQGNEQTSIDSHPQNANNQEDGGANNHNDTTETTSTFRSRFPGLELDNFEESLDDWTVVALRQTIAKQGSTLSRAAPEIDALVKTIRLQYEKRMLMAALMGGLPEAVVWAIVRLLIRSGVSDLGRGEGGRKGHSNCWIRFLGFCKLALEEKLPARANKQEWVTRNKKLSDIWQKLTKDEKMVFRDPFFFSLANLPDFSYIENDDVANAEEDLSMEHLEAEVPPPKVHRLSEADRLKYQPLFDRLVDVEKLHICHGRPEPTSSVTTLQKKSIAELRKAHHDFSVVCQRYQITYYLTAVSCGSFEGWSQVFSNNLAFAEWASKAAKVPSKFATYIHGKTVEKEIEGSRFQQPSDERKTRLTRELNSLVDAVYKGNIFPKVRDPEGEIERRGWPIRIIQKEGSLLSKDALKTGHRNAKDSTIRLWLKDIENQNFVIEKNPEKNKKSKKPPRSPCDSSDEQPNPTQSQAQGLNAEQNPRSPPRSNTSRSQSSEEEEQQPRARLKRRVPDDSSSQTERDVQGENQGTVSPIF
ncbi:hypothetical protein DFH28DRAFT_1088085 [Melampsora americana]|nr:hypothetical protein DFH28DRAFT_1088085 [Melampsora americana]